MEVSDCEHPPPISDNMLLCILARAGLLPTLIELSLA